MSLFHMLVVLDKKVMGLSDVQVEMLTYFYEGIAGKVFRLIKERSFAKI